MKVNVKEEYIEEIIMYSKALERYQNLQPNDRAEAISLKKYLVAVYDRMNEIYYELRQGGRENAAEKDRWGNRMKMIKEMYVDCRTTGNQQKNDWGMD